jgi:hypothetical protein
VTVGLDFLPRSAAARAAAPAPQTESSGTDELRVGRAFWDTRAFVGARAEPSISLATWRRRRLRARDGAAAEAARMMPCLDRPCLRR